MQFFLLAILFAIGVSGILLNPIAFLFGAVAAFLFAVFMEGCDC